MEQDGQIFEIKADQLKQAVKEAYGVTAVGWYFWDECWCEAHGPYDTQHKAEKALAKYAKTL
jgi:hypothetical protein